jgi:prepilin-type N-terminal cleavage/methylation domain-containing protein/prepilin-type processing-associated H-X9-DG protein
MNSNLRKNCRQASAAPRLSQAPQAFTLMELLVVIAIVAILASFMMPVMTSMRARADQTKCISNLRQLVIATTLAANENGGRYPIMRGYSWEPNYDPASPWLNDVLAGYIAGGSIVPGKVADILRCPSAIKNPNETWLSDPNYSSYKYNVYYAQDKMPQFGATDAMLFHDSTWEDWPASACSHRGLINVAYVDGHIGSITYDAYQTLDHHQNDDSQSDLFQLGWVK